MGSRAIEAVKRILPPQRWRAVRRASNRMRWLLKFRLMRYYGFPIARRPFVALKYMLWDPEVESFSYDVGNLDEMARFLAPILDVTPAQVAQWLDEARTDPILTRDRGFHWSSKRRQPLGNRTLWYPVIRALKPKLVVEAGVHEGLGSEMVLVALKRNAAEGHPGKLVAFDIFEDTGWQVAPELRDHWEFVLESTMTGMQRVLQGREVDVFVHETPHTDETINHEVGVAMRHAGPRGLAVVDTSGRTCSALEKLCASYGVDCHYFLDVAHNHVVRSNGTKIAIFDRAAIDRGPDKQASAPQAARERSASSIATAVLTKGLLTLAACGEGMASAFQSACAVA